MSLLLSGRVGRSRTPSWPTASEKAMVVDASLLIEALAVEDPGGPIGERLAAETVLHAPTHIGSEFTTGIRRLELHKTVSLQRAEEALNDFLALPVLQHR